MSSYRFALDAVGGGFTNLDISRDFVQSLGLD